MFGKKIVFLFLMFRTYLKEFFEFQQHFKPFRRGGKGGGGLGIICFGQNICFFYFG